MGVTVRLPEFPSRLEFGTLEPSSRLCVPSFRLGLWNRVPAFPQPLAACLIESSSIVVGMATVSSPLPPRAPNSMANMHVIKPRGLPVSSTSAEVDAEELPSLAK